MGLGRATSDFFWGLPFIVRYLHTSFSINLRPPYSLRLFLQDHSLSHIDTETILQGFMHVSRNNGELDNGTIKKAHTLD